MTVTEFTCDPPPPGPDHLPFALWSERVSREFDEWVAKNGCCGKMDKDGRCLGRPTSQGIMCFEIMEIRSLLGVDYDH